MTASERRQRPRFRVTVYLSGKPQFFNNYKIEELADDYARDMRTLYRNTGLPVFVRKTILRA